MELEEHFTAIQEQIDELSEDHLEVQPDRFIAIDDLSRALEELKSIFFRGLRINEK